MKSLALLCLAFVCGGCFSYYPSKLPDERNSDPWDEFKEEDRYLLTLNVSPKERNSGLYRMHCTFLREIDQISKDEIAAYVVLNKSQTSFYPESVFYIKAEDKIFKIHADIKETEQYMTTSESTKDIIKADSSTVTVVDSYSIDNYVQQRFKFTFNQELKYAILASNKLSFRFYSGGLASTFEINGGDLHDLKVLIDEI